MIARSHLGSGALIRYWAVHNSAKHARINSANRLLYNTRDKEARKKNAATQIAPCPSTTIFIAHRFRSPTFLSNRRALNTARLYMTAYSKHVFCVCVLVLGYFGGNGARISSDSAWRVVGGISYILYFRKVKIPTYTSSISRSRRSTDDTV